MKRCIALLCVLSFAPTVFAQTAMEKAEKRLAELLAPGSGIVLPSPQPIAWKPGRAVGLIDVPIQSLAVAPVRLTQSPLKGAMLGGVPEGQPLVSFRDESQGPKKVELPTKPLIRLPSIDMHTPLPIPILSRPKLDRASLAEPAFEASLDAAMKKYTPARTRAVQFVPYNLPDPFEHVRHGQLRNPPEESATPPVIPLQRPTK